MKVKLKCDFCGKEIKRYKSQIKNKKHLFCSIKCKNNWQKEHPQTENLEKWIGLSGKDNPNYGNKWNDNQKKHMSKILKERYKNLEYRWSVGKSNRGKKFSKERIERMHGHRTKESYSTPKSAKTRKKIGIKSAQKFTLEYRIKQRKKMEELGYWMPLNQIDSYKLYCKFANWNKKMFDLISDEKQTSLLSEYGVFNTRKNRNGVVRDHMYSRQSGFKNNVFPEILRHPANCRIVLHSENTRTSRCKNVSDDILSLNELFKRIKNYKLTWHEQDMCIKLISKYELGKRYKKENYIKKIYEGG